MHIKSINRQQWESKWHPPMPTFCMGDLEERLLFSSLKQPLSWFRFIDDVDMKWIYSDKELDEFLEHANSIHPSIKFTPTWSAFHFFEFLSKDDGQCLKFSLKMDVK
jgi:hypothetical protein